MASHISIDAGSNFPKFRQFMKRINNLNRKQIREIMDKYGKIGVESLRLATPQDTGLTANSWNYSYSVTKNHVSLEFYNTNTNGEYNIAILIDRGHGTKNGSYVAGRNFINPTLKPVFEAMKNNLWKDVINING